MNMHRRDILKLGLGGVITAVVTPFGFAQSSFTKGGVTSVSAAAPTTPAAAIDGNISYNAGWVVPLEDKASLLALEAKKTKEKDEASKQQAGNPSTPASKEKSKSVSDRIQEAFAKVKSWF